MEKKTTALKEMDKREMERIDGGRHSGGRHHSYSGIYIPPYNYSQNSHGRRHSSRHSYYY